MPHLLLIAAGGAAGALLRYSACVLLQQHTRLGSAWATLGVNLLGSFLIGLFYAWAASRDSMPENLRLLIAVGMLGALTTFSTFSFETLKMLQQHLWLAAAANVAGNNLLCLAAAWLGFRLLQP